MFKALVRATAAQRAISDVSPMQFHGQMVLKGTPTTESHLEAVRLLQDEGVDFWIDPSAVGSEVAFRVESDVEMKKYETLFSAVGMDLNVWIQDVQKAIDGTKDKGLAPAYTATHLGSDVQVACIESYDTYETTVEWMEQLASLHEFANIVTIGQTLLGADILGLEIDTDLGRLPSKPGYFMDGGIHAREWIAPATVKNILANLIEGYTQREPRVIDIFEGFVWTFVPVLNVDGYRYSFDSNRMWRKTRRNNGDGSFGVDANRNSDIAWATVGSSNNPASDSYHGPFANSEPCVTAVHDYIRSKPSTVAYWNVHSFGEEVIVPYAYGREDIPADREQQLDAAWDMWNAIRDTTGRVFDEPRTPNGRYGGFMMDYLYDAGVKFSGLLELRDRGQFGFLLPESQICESGHEMYEGVVAHASNVIRNL